MATKIEEHDWTQPYYNPAEHGWFKADVGGEKNNYGYPSDYFFADTMRAISTAFGKKFSNIVIIREDEKGYPRKHIEVPIKFGPRTKAHDYRTELEAGQIDENGVVEQKYYIQNPCMTWKFTNGSYDGSRQTSSNEIRAFYDKYFMSRGIEMSTCDLFWKDTMVIPVNIGIQLKCYADKDADLNRMFEMIMRKTKDSAMFLYVKEFWFMNIRRDIKVKLTGFNFDYGKDDIGAEDKREVSVTFDFICEAFVYRPIEQTSLITSIVTTLNPNIAYGPIMRFGISGNAYMHEKYSNSATYMEAAQKGIFDGSLTSAYDFTVPQHQQYENMKVAVGLASAMVSSYDIPFTQADIEAISANYPGASALTGYTTKYVYSAIPDTWREFDREFSVLDSSTYIFGNVKTSAIKNGVVVEDVTSGTCLTSYNYRMHPYRNTQFTRNFINFDTKDLEDSKHNIIHTIYGTSHANYYPVYEVDTRTEINGEHNSAYMIAPYVVNPINRYIYITPFDIDQSTSAKTDLEDNEYMQWFYGFGDNHWHKLGTITINFAS